MFSLPLLSVRSEVRVSYSAAHTESVCLKDRSARMSAHLGVSQVIMSYASIIYRSCKMCGYIEKNISRFTTAQGDILKLVILSKEQSKIQKCSAFYDIRYFSLHYHRKRVVHSFSVDQLINQLLHV